MTHSKHLLTGLLVLGALVIGACASGPVNIPEGLSAAELIQKGQEASDKNRYKLALQYYAAITNRFPYDLTNLCAAEYEIAFIHYKQKKYAEARREFDALLARYEIPDAELLPQEFLILARIVRARIPDKS